MRCRAPEGPRARPLRSVLLRGCHRRLSEPRRFLGPFYPLLKQLVPKHVTTTANVGLAMIEVAAQGHTKLVLENPDINSLAIAV